MINTFLITRFVFLVLLVYLTLLLLAFVTWNVMATSSSGFDIPGSAIVLLFNSACSLILISMSFLELLVPRFRIAHLKFESGWLCVMTIMQITASIGFTASKPTALMCDEFQSLCSSSSLVVPVTWINSLIFLMYFTVLVSCTMAMREVDPDIWSKTVYIVDWFPTSSNKVVEDLPRDSWSLYIENIAATCGRDATEIDIEKVQWTDNMIRRGIDVPFARRPERDGSASESSSGMDPSDCNNISLPNIAMPSKVETRNKQAPPGSRFIERLADAQAKRISNPFPNSVVDESVPIPLPRLSKWIRAGPSSP